MPKSDTFVCLILMYKCAQLSNETKSKMYLNKVTAFVEKGNVVISIELVYESLSDSK